VALFIEAGDDRTRNKLQTTGETEQVPKLGRRTARDRQEVNMVPCGSDVRNPRRVCVRWSCRGRAQGPARGPLPSSIA